MVGRDSPAIPPKEPSLPMRSAPAFDPAFSTARCRTAVRSAVGMAWMVLAVAWLGVGCATPREVSDRDVRSVSVRWVEKMLGSGDDVALIDVRSSTAYRAGHLPGAFHVPLPNVRPGHAALSGVGTVVVYGEGYDDPLSGAAAKKLLAERFDRVVVMEGGVEAWQASGRRLSQQSPM